MTTSSPTSETAGPQSCESRIKGERTNATLPDSPELDEEEAQIVSNENALNVAFLSFLGFTTLQLFFAILAKSQSMMADCAAMYVDVISYLVNYLAEKLKHGHSDLSPRQLRLHRLKLELVPPLLSVITLVAVTIMALQKAIETLIREATADESGKPKNPPPDLRIMLIFSGLNLLLDFVNVGYFVKADQAVGLPGQHGEEHVHVEYEHTHHKHHEHREDHDATDRAAVATEETPLVQEDNSTASTESECESEGASIGRNLNMCSAWTHVCADTLRSVAVLVAAAIGFMFPGFVTPIQADSAAAVLVSVIILISLAPLIQGLFFTACKIREIWLGLDRHNHHLDHVLDV